MEVLSVCLIMIGIAVIVVSYFISDKVAEERMKQKAEELILSMDTQALLTRQTKETVDNVLGTMTEDITANLERELGKLSNEKIMAVHDYSETVLGEINKSHNEVMFLYSMLDEKDKEVRQTAAEVADILKGSVRTVKKEPQVSAEYEQMELFGATGLGNNQGAVVQKEDAVVSSEEGQRAFDSNDAKNINDKNRETILELSSKGYSNVEIAKMLKMGVGEVQLVVGLFQGANK